MEDNIDTILFDKSSKFLFTEKPNSCAPWVVTGVTGAVYALWTLFVFLGFRKVPFKFKVPYLPSNKPQTANVVKLLQGRKGRLVDLGSGDGRLVFAAASMGFHSTGYELNPILLNWAKLLAYRRGVSQDQATFLKQDFWVADLSKYSNVTVFLAPAVVNIGLLPFNIRLSAVFSCQFINNTLKKSQVESLKKKLADELPDNSRVIVCRFPLTGWSPTCSEGSGLDQVWAYDMANVRKGSNQSPS